MTAHTLLATLATLLLMATAGAQVPQPPAATAASAGVPQPPGLPTGGAPAGQPPKPAVASTVQQPAVGAPVAMQALPEERSTLGRLFFTPSERARLDELRHRPQATRVEAAKAAPPPPPPAPRYVTVNGVVRRSDGESTIWLNNKPVPGQQAAEGLIASPTRGQLPSHVTVRVPETGRSIDVKVGQQLEVNSGAVQEAYRTSAPAPAPAASTPRAEAPDTRTGMRRNDREREFLRDLLRDIEAESAAAGANRQGAPAAQSEVRR